MVRKKERLTHGEFNRFFSAGRRNNTTHLQCVHTPYNTFHAAVVVPKKIAPKAVTRNGLRRKIYHLLKRTTKETGVYIVIVKKIPPNKEMLISEVNTVINNSQKEHKK